MELCKNGEILEFVKQYRETNGIRYPMKKIIRMLQQISSAVEFIHSRNIIHRDLKPENVLLDESENVRLMDFGISRVVEAATAMKTRNVGTSYYMAPETLSGFYDEKVDSFSFAILMWALITENEFPYGKNCVQIEFSVANDPKFRPSLEELQRSLYGKDMVESRIKKFSWLEDMIVTCWKHEPEDRFSFKQISEFFANQSVELKFDGDDLVVDHEEIGKVDDWAKNLKESYSRLKEMNKEKKIETSIIREFFENNL